MREQALAETQTQKDPVGDGQPYEHGRFSPKAPAATSSELEADSGTSGCFSLGNIGGQALSASQTRLQHSELQWPQTPQTARVELGMSHWQGKLPGGEGSQEVHSSQGQMPQCLTAQRQDASEAEVKAQLSSLTSMVHALQEEVKRSSSRVVKAEQEAAHFRQLMAEYQATLDRQASTALKTAAGLERVSNSLSAVSAALVVPPHALTDAVDGPATGESVAVQRAKQEMQDVREDISVWTQSLKGSLGQLLQKP